MPTITLTGTPPAHDVMYFLDSAAECFHIPPDVYLWAKYFHPNITGLVDSLDSLEELKGQSHLHTLARWGHYLEKLYLDWQQEAPIEEVTLCLGYGLNYLPTIKDIVHNLVGTLVDRTDSFMVDLAINKDFEAHRTTDLVFYDGIKKFHSQQACMESFYRIKAQWEALEVKPDFKDYQVITSPPPTLNELRAHVRGKEQAQKIFPKETKRALKRSAEVLDSIAGKNTASLFLSGEEIIVTGQKYKFSLTKDPYGTITGSHGACRTRVLCAETNEFIASLCIYTPNVTVFDHLASLVLHCTSGLEDIIIMESNIINRGNIDKLPPAKIEEITKPRISDSEYDLFMGETKAIARKKRDLLELKNQKMHNKLVSRVACEFPWIVNHKKPQNIPSVLWCPTGAVDLLM